MSKKNQTKKAPAKKEAETKGKPVKGIIIAVVALLLIAAVIVAAVLIKKDGGTTDPTSGVIETLPDDGGQYTYAKYKSTSLPVEFVEILNKAEADSAAACKNQGVVLEIGNREISVPEFTMYYYDEYSMQVDSVQYSIEKSGANRTGFDLGVMPAEQRHLGSDGTWEEHFVEDAIDKMREVYMIFDLAVEAGTKLDVVTISGVLQNIDLIETTVEKQGITADESLSNYYGDGMTAAMYNARDIMMAYAQAYENDKLADIRKGYSDSQLQEVLDTDRSKFTVVVGRVYPIEGVYNEAEASAVKNEQDFIAYANKNYPTEGYDAEYSTDCTFVLKETISDVYGEEVADWMFSSSRSDGDIAVVQGKLFNYLCYVEKVPFLATSSTVISCVSSYSSDMGQEDRDRLYNALLEKYEKWQKDDGTKEGFEQMSVGAGGYGETTVRVADYYFEVSKWIFDSERKPGDSTIINTSVGCAAVYFVSSNEDDYDWMEYAAYDRSELELTDYYANLKAKEYKDKRDARAVADSCKAAETFIQRKMDKMKAETTTAA